MYGIGFKVWEGLGFRVSGVMSSDAESGARVSFNTIDKLI